jgi:Rrf2 family iron-sulfur cluster assembly transcriptional regulator
MRLSTKSRFAVTAMIDVTLRQHLGPVSLAAISVRHQISLSYLEQLFSRLRADGLVESTRGPGGGYALGRAAQTITLADIIAAVEGRSEPETDAPDAAGRMTQELWQSLNTRMIEHMQTINLHGLAQEQRARGAVVDTRPAGKSGVFKQRKPEPVRPSAPNSVFALAGALARSR